MMMMMNMMNMKEKDNENTRKADNHNDDHIR